MLLANGTVVEQICSPLFWWLLSANVDMAQRLMRHENEVFFLCFLCFWMPVPKVMIGKFLEVQPIVWL